MLTESLASRSSQEELARAMTKRLAPGEIDSFNATGQFSFLGVPPNILAHYFQDGRFVGMLMDHVLAARYTNLSAHPKGNNTGFDLYQAPDKKSGSHTPLVWESKTWTKNGCDLAPSNMKGKGRKFSAKTFKAGVQNLTGGFIVTDVRKFPEMRIFAVPSDVHAKMGHPRKLRDADVAHISALSSATKAPLKPVVTGSAKEGYEITHGFSVFTVKPDSKKGWAVKAGNKLLGTAKSATAGKKIALDAIAIVSKRGGAAKPAAKKASSKKSASKRATKK